MPHHVLQKCQQECFVDMHINSLETRQDDSSQDSLREGHYHYSTIGYKELGLRDDNENMKDRHALSSQSHVGFVETSQQKKIEIEDRKPITCTVQDSQHQSKLKSMDSSQGSELVSEIKNSLDSDTMKPKDESEEKELVNGALLALVSLSSSRLAPGSKDESQNHQSVNAPRERNVQTPSPPQNNFLSMVTPSNSAVTPHMMNNRTHSSSTSNNIVTEVPSHSSPSSVAGSKTVEYNHLDRASIKHPLCVPKGIAFPQGPNQTPYRLSPRRRTQSLPVLDKHSFDEPSNYNLIMKKDSYMYERRPDFHYEEDIYHLPGPNPIHMAEVMPRRRSDVYVSSKAHIDSDRRASYHYNRDTTLAHPPPPRYRPGGFYHHSRDPIIYDYPPKPHMRERLYADGRRGVSLPRYDTMRHELNDRRYSTQDDYEEMRQPHHYARRYHHPHDMYYSRPNHYHTAPSRAHHEHYQRPKHLTQSNQATMVPVALQSNNDDHIEFHKHSSSIGHDIVVGSKNCEYPSSPYQPKFEGNYAAQGVVKKTVLKKKCAWKNYPELEAFLIENRDEYFKYSAKNYTSEQKQYNNRLTERLLEVAAKHNYVFDPNDFSFVAVRDRIRCYFKSYVQSNKKRGIVVGYDASGSRKKQKIETVENESPVTTEGSDTPEVKSNPELSHHSQDSESEVDLTNN